MLEYGEALALARVHRAWRQRAPVQGQALRLATLGSFTTDPLVRFLELFLFASGIGVERFESDYGVLDQEILDPSSPLHAFRPDFVFLATSWRDLRHTPTIEDTDSAARAAVDAELLTWTARWQTLRDHLGCHIVQNGFTPPPWRSLGNLEMARSSSASRFISDVNRAMYDNAPGYVTVHDVDHLAATAGRWRQGQWLTPGGIRTRERW